MTPRPRLLKESNTRTRYVRGREDETLVPQAQLLYMAHARVQGYAWRVYRPVREACPDFDRDTGDHVVFAILRLTEEATP